MPIVLLLVGVLLIVVGINNKLPDLMELVKDDFAPKTGQISFPVWIAAIFIAGSLGYVKELKPIANGFLVLIVIGIIFSNRGFFAKFTAEIQGK